jgi:hypothetical protein
MAGYTFRRAIRDLARTAQHLSAHYGERLLGVLALGADLTLEAHRLALKAPWLRTEDSPDDALPLVGAERNMERAPAETNPQYRARLLDAWTLWGQGGQRGDTSDADENNFAQNALEPFDVNPASVATHYEPDDGWDGANPDNWSLFWVILTEPLPWTRELWGNDGTWGNDGVWGIGTTPAVVSALRRFLTKTKAGWELGVDLIIDWGDDVWGTPGVWGSDEWGGDVSRLPLGRLWDSDGTWGDPHPTVVGKPDVWGGKINA